MLLTILSAVFFYLSFPNKIFIYGFWPCIWVFAVPLLLALHDQPLRHRWAIGLWWGLCAYGLMAQGLFRISPAGFLAFVLALSIQALIFGCLFRASRSLAADILYIPGAWCMSEWARNSLLGGFSFYISHAQAFCPMMLKLYGTFGCLGMSFIIFCVNGLIYLAVVNHKKRWEFMLAAGTIFLIVASMGVLKKDTTPRGSRPLRICVIQANISPLEKMDLNLFDRNAQVHLLLTEQAYAQNHPDLVIWPETAFPDDLLQSDQWRPMIMSQAAHMHADLLVGMAPIIDGKEYNSALLINALSWLRSRMTAGLQTDRLTCFMPRPRSCVRWKTIAGSYARLIRDLVLPLIPRELFIRMGILN